MDSDRVLGEILALAPDAIVAIDEEQRIVLFSRGAEKIFGVAASEVLGKPLDVLLPDTIRSEHRQYVRAFAISGVSARLMGERGEIVGRRYDGELFPAEASITRIEIDGRPLHAAVLRDVSERKRRDEELRRSRAELADAQRLAQVGSWEWEVGSDFVHCSEELHRIYGEPPSARIPYVRFVERIHADDRAKVRSAMETAVRSGGAFELEHRIHRADGAIRTLQVRGRGIRDATNRTVRVVGTGQDITDRLQAEERERALLQEQAARSGAEAAAAQFRFLAEAGAILGSSLDIEVTLRNLTRLAVPRIADWCSLDLVEPNGELRRVEVAHSNPEREAFAREVYRLYPADPKVRNAPALALQRGEPILLPDFNEELLAATARDHRHLELLRSFGFRSVMVVPMIARDRLVGLITLATAESQRRFGTDDVALVRSLANRAALAIENAHLFEQARAATRAREEAVATVSHDLRSPLSAAITNVALLRESALSPEHRARAIERVERALTSMRRMIETLLDVARLEAGGVKLDVQVAQVAPVLVEACELIHPAAAARSVTLVHEAEVGLRMRCDRDRVIQVLCNLIENAVRHSPEGGRVRVWARSIDGRTLFCVADQGPGVPEELRDRIFQRFWQRDVNPRQGAGLGLAIARGLVELHGGRIWVDSPENRGARFYFTLESESMPPPTSEQPPTA